MWSHARRRFPCSPFTPRPRRRPRYPQITGSIRASSSRARPSGDDPSLDPPPHPRQRGSRSADPTTNTHPATLAKCGGGDKGLSRPAGSFHQSKRKLRAPLCEECPLQHIHIWTQYIHNIFYRQDEFMRVDNSLQGNIFFGLATGPGGLGAWPGGGSIL